jgi:hypothetical protein
MISEVVHMRPSKRTVARAHHYLPVSTVIPYPQEDIELTGGFD